MYIYIYLCIYTQDIYICIFVLVYNMHIYIYIYIYIYNIYASFEMCFDYIHINNLCTQTPRDMSFIPDVSVHYIIFKGFCI